MKWIVKWTIDYGETIEQIVVTAISYTEAYIAAMRALPDSAAILEIKKEEELKDIASERI